MGKWGLLLALLTASANAEELQYLDHSELALSRLYHDISQAESTIDLTYFIWDPCSSVSKVLVKKLAEKKRAGVKVRAVVDAIKYRDMLGPMSAYFRNNGIDLKFFSPPSLDLSKLNYRTHSKLTLIDRKLPGKARMVTGGRNLDDHYYGLSDRNFVDRDVAVRGPSTAENPKGVIGQAEGGFERLWEHPDSRRVSPTSEGEEAEKLRACTRWTAKDRKLEAHLKANASRITASEQPIRCDEVSFTLDGMRHRGAEDRALLQRKPTTAAVVDFLKSSQRSLTLENQYYIPDEDFAKRIIAEKRRNGVRIDVYSNRFDDRGDTLASLVYAQSKHMREDHRGSQTNHRNWRIAGLLDRWDLTPKNATYSYHSKVFVADGKDTAVSSFNFDPRSTNTNGESALIARSCPAFARRVEQITKITGRAWTLEEKLGDCEGRPRGKVVVNELFGELLEELF